MWLFCCGCVENHISCSLLINDMQDSENCIYCYNQFKSTDWLLYKRLSQICTQIEGFWGGYFQLVALKYLWSPTKAIYSCICVK